ncbi:CrcB family protein [Enterococcus faecium]|nr:CrcB family protein [Enterococcus faecium]
MLNQYVSVGIGCFLGGCLRYFISKKLNTKFPIGTLGANVVGAFLIGFFFIVYQLKTPYFICF